MHTPQILYIVLSAGGLLIAANKHGKEKKGKDNFWISLIATIVTFGLLIWGGFFN